MSVLKFSDEKKIKRKKLSFIQNDRLTALPETRYGPQQGMAFGWHDHCSRVPYMR